MGQPAIKPPILSALPSDGAPQDTPRAKDYLDYHREKDELKNFFLEGSREYHEADQKLQRIKGI